MTLVRLEDMAFSVRGWHKEVDSGEEFRRFDAQPRREDDERGERWNDDAVLNRRDVGSAERGSGGGLGEACGTPQLPNPATQFEKRRGVTPQDLMFSNS